MNQKDVLPQCCFYRLKNNGFYFFIAIPSLALDVFVLLNYYFFDVCNVYFAFCSFFFQQSKLQKIGSIRIIDTVLLRISDRPNH